MKDNLLEHIILYLLVICAALVMATLTRMSAIAFGLDSFTANMAFIIILGISAIVYFSIQAVLLGVMMPVIGKLLMKIPYFKRRQMVCPPKEEEQTNEIHEKTLVDTEKEREKHQQLTKRQKDQHLNVALDYARRTFAPYLTDSQIEDLCKNIIVFVGNNQDEAYQSIKVDGELRKMDIYHFGWNIWHHFGVGVQLDIACFLKAVFKDIFRDVEVGTIKSHLKDDENKGLIRIKENLLA